MNHHYTKLDDIFDVLVAKHYNTTKFYKRDKVIKIQSWHEFTKHLQSNKYPVKDTLVN